MEECLPWGTHEMAGKKKKSYFDLKSSQHCYLYWQVNAVVLQHRTRSVCSFTSLHPSDLWDASAHRLPLNLTILCLKRWMFNPRPQSVGSGRWISPGCACVFCSYAKMSVWVPVSEVFFFLFFIRPGSARSAALLTYFSLSLVTCECERRGGTYSFFSL